MRARCLLAVVAALAAVPAAGSPAAAADPAVSTVAEDGAVAAGARWSSADGSRVVFQSPTADGAEIRWYDARERRTTLVGPGTRAAISADGERIAFRSFGVAVVTLDSGREDRLPYDTVAPPSLSADGSHVAFANGSGAYVWERRTGRTTKVSGTRTGCEAVSLSSDDRTLVFACGNDVLSTRIGSGSIQVVAAQHELVAASDDARTVLVTKGGVPFVVRSGRRSPVLVGPSGAAVTGGGAVLSRSGRYVAFAGRDRDAGVYRRDVREGTTVRVDPVRPPEVKPYPIALDDSRVAYREGGSVVVAEVGRWRAASATAGGVVTGGSLDGRVLTVAGSEGVARWSLPRTLPAIPTNLVVDDASAPEDGGTIRFTVRLDRPAEEASSARWSVYSDQGAPVGRRAIPGVDFEKVTGTVTFAPGQQTAMIDVPLIDDLLREADETFVLHLFEAVNVHLSKGNALGTILDDERAG